MKFLIFSFVLFLFFPVDDYSQDSDNQSSRSFSMLKHSKLSGFKNKNLSKKSMRQLFLKNQSFDGEVYNIHSKSNRSFNMKKSSGQIMSEEAHTESFLTGYTIQVWNGSDWVDESIYIPTYDETNYIVEEVWQTWNGSNWINSEREVETHDANNNWLEWIYYKWNGSEWIENDRETQTYDENNNWIEWFDYDWNGSDWIYHQRATQSYDANGAEIIYYLANGSEWKNDYRETLDFDANGNWIERIGYYWNNSQWENYYKETQDYDANGNWIEWIGYYWNNSQWENDERETLSYNSNNDWVEWISFIWNGSGWSNKYKDNATYDSENNRTEWLSQEWNGSNWVNTERYLYTYSATTDVSDASAAIINYSLSNNYPNPFNPSTNIDFKIAPLSGEEFVSLKIYDVLGNEVATLINEVKNAGKYKITFDTRNLSNGRTDLSSGIYFYKLQAGNFTQTKKMILLR